MGAIINDDAEIQVAFALTDPNGNFSHWVGGAIKSILMNTDSAVHFHIMVDGSVTEENRKKLKETSEAVNSKVTFYEMDPVKFASNNPWLRMYTIASLYRLDLPNLLSEYEKVIYLDADLIFNRDIRELWEINLDNYSLAAVHDTGFEKGITEPFIIKDGSVSEKKYFNSGVLVMNLTKIRSWGNLLDAGMKFLTNHPESKLPDQDALNYLFRENTLLLRPDWNCVTIYERENTNELRPVVYHFQGQKHPFFDGMTEYDKLLLRIHASTAWGYEAIENDIVRGLGMLSFKIDMLQNLSYKLSQYCVKRIYYGPDTKGMQNLLKIIPPRNVDYCVGDATKEDMRYGIPVRDFKELRHEKEAETVIFVLPEADCGNAIHKLDELGFQYGKGYFVIPTLLKTVQGGYVI